MHLNLSFLLNHLELAIGLHLFHLHEMLSSQIKHLLLRVIAELLLVMEDFSTLPLDSLQSFLVLPEEAFELVLALSLQDGLRLLPILLE